MLLGMGSAQTDEALFAECARYLQQAGHIVIPKNQQRILTSATTLRRQIGKPILEWTEEDILTAYQTRKKAFIYSCNVFLTFLFLRGYRRPSFQLLESMGVELSRQWKPILEPYRKSFEQTAATLGYVDAMDIGDATNIMLRLVFWCGKPLEEVTRDDFEQFREAYQGWYCQKRGDGYPDPRVHRLEQFLLHLEIIAPVQTEFQYEAQFAELTHPSIRQSLCFYMDWAKAKYRFSTLFSKRRALQLFFLWLQEHYPSVEYLHEVTRPLAIAYAQYLAQQGAAQTFKQQYRSELYHMVRLFFDFLIDEQLDERVQRNPFSSKDVPGKPDMIPRYISDSETRAILAYCEHQATLLEKTVVTILLHTGIRAAELASLKASDVVQIGGVWKVHIHQGKGLKDRLIPLTSRCREVIQAWQNEGWERSNDFLFTNHGRPWTDATRSTAVCTIIREMGLKLGIIGLTPHRFRHTFAVALLNYGIRESALQKLMGHATLGMTLEYARILDQTVERSFSEAVEQMMEGTHSWIPNFFVQEEYTLFAEGDSVSWIRLPLGFCRRNPKLHCESDVKCLLCDRFAIGKEDLPRLQQMYERFLSLGLTLKAGVVAAQIHRLEAPGDEQPAGFIPTHAITRAARR